MKILTMDIETRPALVFAWDVWQQNIHPSQIVEAKAVISFAAKWHGESPVMFRSDFHDSHKLMVRHAWKLLDEADAVVSYNGMRFDIPHLNTEFALIGKTPPSPFKNIDLLRTAKRQFQFSHNKLDHVATMLGLGQKIEHEGFALWVKCMKGDKSAWARMRKYNMQDVLLTEKLYDRLLPWIDHHPSHAIGRDRPVCVNCGGELRRKGTRDTSTGRYVRYVCKSCGRWNRDTERIERSLVTSTSSW